ncbi:hypothetical protein JIN84_20185 [Luteolibacter yonseiensis]|uniref:Uncharacterized protein n=2 Tax=Luteolibacter yonseiensis TaxID=1144680 RepID=A0A934R7Y0_9BACT|nr:hypothetical protein [Luteolibacter yonseiensis]
MSEETLDLVLPDWSGLDTVRHSPLPFALWMMGDQCLLHHWLDFAVNQGATTVRIFAADRPAAIRHVLEDSELWPIKTEFTAVGKISDAPETAIHADWLPGEPSPPPPTNGWELIDRASGIEKAWLARMAGEPDYHLLSIGFSCRIHPEARLIPPYFIGDHVLIGPDCEIGPNAVIGQGSVISGSNKISNSHLSAHSFLGPMTALSNCLLESGVLFNLTHRARIDEIEPHLVSSLEKNSLIVPWKDRLHALFLYLRLGGADSRGKTFTAFDGTVLPGDPTEGLANRVAWLPLVWKGRLPLYGLLPRTREQLESLDHEWQNIIRHAPIGVFSYADSQGCHSPSDAEEAVHAVYQASLPQETHLPPTVEFVRKLQPSKLHPSS